MDQNIYDSSYMHDYVQIYDKIGKKKRMRMRVDTSLIINTTNQRSKFAENRSRYKVI